MSDLSELRKDIDQIDDEILSLLNKRARKSLEVKKTTGGKAPLRRGREIDIVKRMVANNPGPFSDAAIQNIYEAIVYNGRGLQTTIRVAYLGPRGTYSERAATEMFGEAVELVPKRSLGEVIGALDSRVVDVAVFPLENSTEGGVSATHKILQTTDMPIIAEYSLSIQHALLSKQSSVTGVQTVYGHPQALGQCRDWLATHLPDARLTPCESNVAGIERALADPDSAAIAGAHNSVRYGLQVLEQVVNDEPDNTTRFVALAHDAVQATGDDKTSVFCTVSEKTGALYDLLGVFNDYNISLTRLESQPYDGGYGFFIDFLGHCDDEAIAQALMGLGVKTTRLKLLGSYPKELS
jgi:chorismate mutase/prephenate dehydratase